MLTLLTAAMVVATNRPVIGIWAHPSSSPAPGCGGKCEYIAASYVKWVESAGGLPVAIPFNADDKTMDALYQSVNGILLPGGSAVLPGSMKRLFPTIVEDKFPLWGTCLGFEWLMQLGSGDDDILSSNYDSNNISLALNFTQAASTARMLYGTTPLGSDLRGILSDKANPPTMNNHHQGIEPSVFDSNSKLTSIFTTLSTNTDRVGKPFVSQVEAKSAPIYGTQWHPEKNNFEWGVNPADPTLPLEAINHTPPAVKASQAMADFFLTEARKNDRQFPTPKAEYEALIWNTGHLSTYQTEGFSQIYTFHF